jgi:hypothetical protein
MPPKENIRQEDTAESVKRVVDPKTGVLVTEAELKEMQENEDKNNP